MSETIEQKCIAKGVKLTEQRKIIAKIMSESQDHPDDDECWVILAGEWEWYIDGEGTKKVSQNDIVVVQKGVKHKITCIGENPGIRFAITAPDVTHVYAEK